MRLKAIVVVCAMLALVAAVTSARAQSISTADLTGTWSVFQLTTPATTFTGADVRSYSGTLTFDAAGVVTAGMLVDNQPAPDTFTVTGSLMVSAQGLVDGTLTLDDGVTTGPLDVREGRLLLTKHTIVGASTVLGHPGLFMLVKQAGPAFTLTENLAGDWNYHEITPSNNIPPAPPAGAPAVAPTPPEAGDATWVKGSITFHDVPNAFCTDADLVLADGTVRAERTAGPTSFG
jgi:hypothetical protein